MIDLNNEQNLAKAKGDGKKLFLSGSCEFVISATTESQLPNSELPEFAFIGRSNVGKSSIINAITGKAKLARTSNTPGRTQQINFFNLSDKLFLVDLPGYGYAKASKKNIKNWNALIHDYLTGRVQLKRAILLIDSRHPLKDNDKEMMGVLDKFAVVYQVVLTKADKVHRSVIEQRVNELKSIMDTHPAMHPDVIVTSSEDGTGIELLRAHIASVVID